MTEPGWMELVEKIWRLNRVHASTEMSLAYELLKKYYRDIDIFGFQTGEKCLGWEVPPGWDVEKATLKDPSGKTIADWKSNKLSLWTYSTSYKGQIEKKQLLERVISDPKRPDATLFHFRNQYNHWVREWGFSLPHNMVNDLVDGNYGVEIETKHFDTKMEMAEHVHKGSLTDSLLFVGHFDHPQMYLDGLSGCIAGHELISRLKNTETKLTYRMLSTVEIIGSVFYAKHRARKNDVKQALFIATAGADLSLKYQNSFAKTNYIDSVVSHVIKHFDSNSKTYDFREGPLGNDEIAYDVGGVNIPCGSLMRGAFENYHSDKDTPSNGSIEKLEEMINVLEEIVYIFENNCLVRRTFDGLPRLSARKGSLYLEPANISGLDCSYDGKLDGGLVAGMKEQLVTYLKNNTHKLNILMNTIPNMAEGTCTILEIAEYVGLPFRFVDNYLKLWIENKLITTKWRNPFEKH